MPRPGPEAGRRAVEEDSPAGIAYGTLARSLQRRRAELAALMRAGGTHSSVAESYEAEHPLEPKVTSEEIDAAVGEAGRIGARRAKETPSPRSGRTR
jgi:hypothetical protein